MKCPKCGKELAAGCVYCETCGSEIQIVPDYDPLDELVIEPDKMSEKEPLKPERESACRKHVSGEESLAPRRNWRLKLWKKCALFTACLLICVCAVGLSYMAVTRDNNYAYQLRRGRALAKDGEYEEAIPYLERAQELQAQTEGSDTEPLRLLAYAYAGAGKKEAAVSSMKAAVSSERAAHGESDTLLALYEELMDILNLTGQTDQIEAVIDACPYASIVSKLRPYLIEKPSCSVPEGSYSYYLRLELKADYGTIYYTLDGTTPTKESTLYEKPIELQKEGEVLLSAVAINEKGMVSVPLVMVYKLEFQDYPADEL